jgi:hypothetical protein
MAAVMQDTDEQPFTPHRFAAIEPSLAAADAEALAEGVSAMLRIARGLIEGRRQVDLGGLDAMVGWLCARALDLPPEHGRALRPRLVLLLTELDALTGALAPP